MVLKYCFYLSICDDDDDVNIGTLLLYSIDRARQLEVTVLLSGSFLDDGVTLVVCLSLSNPLPFLDTWSCFDEPMASMVRFLK